MGQRIAEYDPVKEEYMAATGKAFWAKEEPEA